MSDQNSSLIAEISRLSRGKKKLALSSLSQSPAFQTLQFRDTLHISERQYESRVKERQTSVRQDMNCSAQWRGTIHEGYGCLLVQRRGCHWEHQLQRLKMFILFDLARCASMPEQY